MLIKISSLYEIDVSEELEFREKRYSSNFWLTFWRLTTHIWVVPHR